MNTTVPEVTILLQLGDAFVAALGEIAVRSDDPRALELLARIVRYLDEIEATERRRWVTSPGVV